MKITRLKNDVNGNGRFAVHFLEFISEKDRNTEGYSVFNAYEIALKKARRFGGRKYNNKSYGGGIAFQAYSENEIEEIIKRANA